MINVIVKFNNYLWDNYQGASGNIETRTIVLNLPKDTAIGELNNLCVDELHKRRFIDGWDLPNFTGKGLISIEVQ